MITAILWGLAIFLTLTVGGFGTAAILMSLYDDYNDRRIRRDNARTRRSNSESGVKADQLGYTRGRKAPTSLRLGPPGSLRNSYSPEKRGEGGV